MAAKFTILFTLLCVVAYGMCLSCNSCNSKKDCENPKTENCPDDKKYCVSAGVKSNNAYFKGCFDKGNSCEIKDSNGNIAYKECESCQMDNCNNLKFT